MLECTIWDVQHGSAATLKTPNGKYIHVDLGVGSYGSRDSVFSPLLHLKRRYGVNRLDAVIMTHPHRDHLDDIHNFYDLHPRLIYRANHLSESDIRNSNTREDTSIIDQYLSIDRDYSNPIPSDLEFSTPTNFGGVTIQVFGPTDCSTSNLNNHSLVTVFQYANSKILIPGDNEPASWKELLQRQDFLNAIRHTDIFVAPHHGRDSGYCAELFREISPKLIIISDGRFCDTSATSRYSQQASGWTVHKRSGGSVDRKCVTTRNDGVINVSFGMDGQQPFIYVKID